MSVPVREASNEFTRAETAQEHLIDSRSITPEDPGMDKEVDKPIEYEQLPEPRSSTPEPPFINPAKIATRRPKKRREPERLTFRQARELERIAEKQYLGPGSYVGNDLTFGTSTQNVKFTPEK